MVEKANHIQIHQKSGAVAAGHIAIAETAAEVLNEGGNAVDAAIASYLVACIAEPCMASLAAGFFALYWPKDTKPVALDAFCQTPGEKKPMDQTEFFPVEVDFGSQKELFYAGMGSVAVPTAIDGLFSLHQRYASMPLPELAQPAIEAAARGIPLSNFQHHDLTLLTPIYRHDALLRNSLFTNGQLNPPGSNFSLQEFSDYLYFLCRDSARSFYEGEVADRLIQLSESNGGHLSSRDLKSASAHWSDAICTKGQSGVLYTVPYPSYGAYMLRYWFDSYGRRSAGDFPEKIRRTFRDTFAISRPPASWTKNLSTKGTSHFSIIDRSGHSIGVTYSIGEGSGRVIPGTGVHLNNMLGESALLPDGFHSWVPAARLVSMMSPAGVFREKDAARIVLGSGGAGRIPFVLAQAITGWLKETESIASVIEKPRIHYDGVNWHAEPGGGQLLPVQGTNKVVWPESNMYFGGVHAVEFDGDGYRAAADFRRDGVGLAW
jgi:gamma-glutamyltranspeptidase / glutathione hydrolase